MGSLHPMKVEALDFLDLTELRKALGKAEDLVAFVEKAEKKALARSKTRASARPVELTAERLREFGLSGRTGAYLSTVSDSRPDRYGDIVEQKGASFEGYRRNPVILWNHNRNGAGEKTAEPPIGQAWTIFSEINRGQDEKHEDLYDRSRVIHTFHRETERSDEIARLWANGILRTHSIGFMPDLNSAERLDPDNPFSALRFNSWDLREDSIVMIPANVGAEAELSDGEIVRSVGEVRLYRSDVEAFLDTQTEDEDLWSRFENVYRGLRPRVPRVDVSKIEVFEKKIASLEAEIEKLRASGNQGDVKPAGYEQKDSGNGVVRLVIGD